MKFFRLDLLTLLISLFILGSCKNEGSIGLGVATSKQLNGTLMDTATIVVNTVPDQGFFVPGTTPQDSISTTGLTKTPLGYFQDPAFGTVQSDIAVGLNLPGSSSYVLPSGTIVIDSAVLALKYADGFYGDSLTSKYKINVYQLQTRPLPSRLYYNTTAWPYDNTNLLGTRTFYARTHDSIKVYNIIAGAPDTLIKVAPQLRIPINPSFVNQILFEAPSDQLSSNTVFANRIKGLYITMDKAGIQGAGGMFMFDLADSLNVFYHTTNGTTIDTASVSLPLTGGSTVHAAYITRSPSTAIQTELANTNTGSRNLIYLQGLAGLRAKISFPYLKSILKSVGGRIVINKAEVVISAAQGTTIPFAAQPKLTMYRYDIAHTPQELQDATPTDPRATTAAGFGGTYGPNTHTYHFNVTAYIQDLMDGKTVDYGTYISTVDPNSGNTTTVDYLPTVQTAGRVIAVGTDPGSPYRIKLNIIYTKINQ
jgi:hypothetical protein